MPKEQKKEYENGDEKLEVNAYAEHQVRGPSWLSARPVTVSVWPASERSSSERRRSHNLIVLSMPAEMTASALSVKHVASTGYLFSNECSA